MRDEAHRSSGAGNAASVIRLGAFEAKFIAARQVIVALLLCKVVLLHSAACPPVERHLWCALCARIVIFQALLCTHAKKPVYLDNHAARAIGTGGIAGVRSERRILGNFASDLVNICIYRRGGLSQSCRRRRGRRRCPSELQSAPPSRGWEQLKKCTCTSTAAVRP